MDLIHLLGYFLIGAFAITLFEKFIKGHRNIPILFLKNFVGVWFVFSGVVKAIDPTGTAIKMEEYFEIFEKYVPALNIVWQFMAHQALPFSIFMIGLEIFLGVALILGVWKKLTLWLLILIIAFFTFLTGFSAITHKVTDCGCFGDFLKLEPIQSFYKDIFLCVLIVIIFLGKKNINELFGKIFSKIILLLLTIAAGIFIWRNIHFEPITDFRPYKVGVSIPDCLKLPPNAKPYKFENTFIYKNKKSGEVKEFKGTWPQDYDNWTFVDRKDVMIQKGEDPKCKDFAIRDANKSDFSNAIFSEEEYVFLIIVENLEKAKTEAFDKIFDVTYDAYNDNKYVYFLTGSSLQEFQEFITLNEIPFEVYSCDATPLKTIMRSNPGLLILKKGKIIAKYHYNELPKYKTLKSTLLK